MILIIRDTVSTSQLSDMLQTLGSYIKLAVDVERQLIAGGGELHADCEQVLIEDGSRQEDIWGADWDPAGEVRFESLINIRPRQGNRSLAIQSPELRQQVERIVRQVFEGG
jgi:hypothetical protein